MQPVRLFSVGHSLFASTINFFHARNLVVTARRTLIVGLVVLLVSNHTLAAPGFVMAGAELGQRAHLWWHRSGWAAKFDRAFPTRSRGQAPKGWDGKGSHSRQQPARQMVEKREDREQKVARVQIFPGDITIQTGQQAVFTAVAYDKDGSSVSGLDVSWEALDEEKNEPAAISKTAVFDAGKPGKYKITADVSGRKAHVQVTVVGMERAPNITSPPGEPVSSHDRPKKTALFAPTSNERSQAAMRNDAKSRGARQPLRASASALSPSMTLLPPGDDPYGWNRDNYTTLDDPGTDRGPVPGHAIDGGAGSGNFQFTAPLIGGLGGRGIDINLGFNYLSRLWHKSGTDMYFDVDRDWVPGWIFGFGKIVMAGTSYVLIDGDGTRHPYSGRPHGDFPAPYTSLQTYEAYTTDGSYINYYAEGYKGEFDNSNGHNMVRAWAKLPNGTTIIYGASANYAMYPTQIIDANGNYITITYRAYWRFFAGQWRFVQEGPNIETITDALGRTIQFYYQRTGAAPDEKDLLTAVTAPGLSGGQQRVIVRLQYETKSLSNAGANYGFQAGLTTRVRNNGVFDAIRAIYYPATTTGYWFGDADSYSPYGMIRKASERRTMTCSAGGGDCATLASLTTQPSIGAGVMSREMTYNHPSQPGYSYPHIFGSLGDTPTYTQMTEDWAGRSEPAPPLTKFSVVDFGSMRRTTIVRPDGVRVEQDMNDDPNSLYYGLLIEDRTYSEEAGGNLLHRSTVNWFRTRDPITDPDNSDITYCAPRPTRTEVFDERNQNTATDYVYGDYYNSLADKIEYGYGGTTRLHRVHSEYDNGANYGGFWINRHTLWFAGGASPDWFGAHIFNHVTSTSVYAADNVTRVAHTALFYDEGSVVPRPDAGQLAGVAWPRGNLTTVKKYADAVNLNESTAVVETREYDACGNVVTLATACCEQTSFEYQAGTRYAWPVVIKRGSPADVNKQNITSYGYDLNTGLLLNSTDANGRSSSSSYQPLTLRPEYSYTPTGAYSFHIYDESGVVYDFAYEAGKSGADFVSRSDKYLDGLGRVGGEIAYGKDYVMDFVHTQYDNLGRLSRQTRPFRGSETPQWTVYEYDKLDRTTKVTAPDGSVTERFYNESSYPSSATQGVPGQIVRARDPWGRERWARFDDQGRLVEVVEPDPNGNGAVATGGMKTNYSYDTLGSLTLVTQGDQTRSFKYDALSRLTHQKLAERDATLNDAGVFVATRNPSQPIYSGGSWSDTFTYDQRSNLIQRVDARGVKTIHNYNNDPLNRLQSVTYDKSGVPAALLNDFPIPDAPSVTYAYMTTGNKNRLQNYVVSNGVGNETFIYDGESRLAQSTQTFAGREGYPLAKNYVWDSLNRMKELYYPVQYGGSGVSKKVETAYDIASRIDSLKFDGATFASNPVYNASSQVESLNVGSFKQETYTYDPQTGLLVNQQVKQGANINLTLGYSYAQNPDMGNNGPKTGQVTRVFDPGTAYFNRNNYYDALGRLKEMRAGLDQANPSWKQTYTYDRYGNRTNVTKSGPGSGSVPLDGLASLAYTNGQGQVVNNRITTAGYVYDPAGNQTRGESASGTWLRYRYDVAGRLVDVRNDSDQSLENYSYGASNQRLKTDYFGGAGAPPTYYVWDGGKVICDFRGSQFSPALGWEKFYIYLGGRLLATAELGGTKYHHPDRLGTRLVSDAANGNITTSQTNLPYGTALETSGAATNRRFTSYDRSSWTGMDYAVNRFYNPAQGRFTQVDPIGAAAASSSDPQTLNLYSYCGNDPVNQVDPDGLFFGKLFGWIGKAFKFLFKVAAIALFVVAMVLLPTMIAAGGFWLASGAWFGWGSWAALMGVAGVAGLAGWHNGKIGAIAGAFLTRLGGKGNFRTPNTFPGGVNAFLQDPNVKVMTRGPDENSSWGRLFLEWLLGVGPEERSFGPNSSMTKSIRSSPDIDRHRKAFCAGGQKPYKGTFRFGLLGWGIDTTLPGMTPTDAEDGLVRSGFNWGRQFVGSFELSIHRIAGSNEVSFVAYNETSIRSLLAGFPFEVSRTNGKSILELPGSTTKQYYSWTETNPCGQK